MSLSGKISSAAWKIASLIASANLATGKSDNTLSDAMETLIAGFHGEVETGTYTFTEETKRGDLPIPHHLGRIPRFVFFWTDSDGTGLSANTVYAYSCINYGTKADYQPDETEVTTSGFQIGYTAYSATGSSLRSATGISNWCDTSEAFGIPSGGSRYYLTGATYHWIVGA